VTEEIMGLEAKLSAANKKLQRLEAKHDKVSLALNVCYKEPGYTYGVI
jgi:hypothetical protein